MATEHQTQGQDNDSYTYMLVEVFGEQLRVSPRHSRNSAEKRSSMDLRFCSVCVCVFYNSNATSLTTKQWYGKQCT